MLLFNRYLAVRIGEKEFGGRITSSPSTYNPVHHIDFRVDHRIVKYPNEATVVLFNLNEDSKAAITEEGLGIEIEAGYWPEQQQGSDERFTDIIFRGLVRKVETYRAGKTTTATEIEAADGDMAYKYARINKTFPAGKNDPLTMVEEMASILATEFGIETRVLRVEGEPEPRATTTHQKVVDALDDISRRYNLIWNIQDNKFEIYPKSEISEEIVTIINQETGMISTPRITNVGLNLETLLIPQIRPGRLIDIKSEFLKSSTKFGNGLYRVDRIIFTGTTLATGKFGCGIESRFFDGEVRRNKYRAGGEGG